MFLFNIQNAKNMQSSPLKCNTTTLQHWNPADFLNSAERSPCDINFDTSSEICITLHLLSSAFICIWMEVNRMKSVLWPAVNRGTHLLIKQMKFYIWPNVTGLFNIILKRQHVNHQTMWVLINDISHIYKTWWEPACYCFSAVTDTQLLSAYIENLRTVNVGRIT